MTGVPINARNQIAVQFAMRLGRQRALRDCSEVFDQMLDQLHQVKAQFDREIRALQSELDVARAELRKLRDLNLAYWQPTNSAPN